MRRLLHRAGRDGHHHRDGRGNRRPRERRRRERREHRRHHRGSHHRRRRRDDRRARRPDVRDGHPQRGPDEPNETASHRASAEAAWSRGWGADRRDGVHPDREPDGGHPDREPDADRPDPARERRRRDGVHPGPVAVRSVPEPDAARAARPERTSRGCCRPVVPSDPAWVREPQAGTGLPVPTRRAPRVRREPQAPPGRRGSPPRVRRDVPGWAAATEPPEPRPGPPRPAPRARRPVRAWVRDADRPAWARSRCRCSCRCPCSCRYRRCSHWSPGRRRNRRRGTTPEGVGRPVLPRSTTRTSRTRPAP